MSDNTLRPQLDYSNPMLVTPDEIRQAPQSLLPKTSEPIDSNFKLAVPTNNPNAMLISPDEIHQEPITQTPGAAIQPEQKRLDGTATLWSWAEPYIKAVQGAYGEGSIFAVDKALQMNRVVQGEINYDDIKDKYNTPAQKQYEALNITPYKTQIPEQLMDYVVKPLVGSFPFIKELFTSPETLLTAGVTTAVGAKFLGAPGAGGGLGLGLMLGMGVTATKLATGDAYASFREAGIPHENAAMAAKGAGVINGALTAIQGGVEGALTKNAIESSAGKEVIKRLIIGQGVNLGAAQLNQATNIVAQAVAAKQAHNPNAMPKDITKHLTETFLQSLAPSLAMGVGGEIAGATIKKLVGQISFNDAINHANENLQTPIGQKEVQPSNVQAITKPVTRASKAAAKRAARLAKQTTAEDEIKRIFTAANSKFIVETAESFTKEKDRIQRVLKNLVDQSDVLDDKTKTKLLKKVLTIDSTKDLLREGEAFIDDVRGVEHLNKIQNAQARIQKLIKNAQPKSNKAKLPPVLQATLQAYAEFFTPVKMVGTKEHPATAFHKNMAMVKKAEDYITKTYNEELHNAEQSLNKIENGQLSELFDNPIASLEKARIAQQAIKYWSNELTPDELNIIADQLETTIKDGRSTFMAAKEAESKRSIQLRADVINGTLGEKGILPSKDINADKQINKLQAVLDHVSKTKTAIWEDLLRAIHPEKREKLISKLDLTDVENKNWKLNNESAEKFKALLEEAAGSFEEAQKLIVQGAKEESFGIKYTDAEGNSKTLQRASINQLIYLRNALTDNTALPGLIEGDKYTLKGMVETGQTSTQEAIDTFLENRNPAYLDLGDAIKDFYIWHAPKVANHYLKEYGVVLKTYDDYSGRLYHYGVPDKIGAPDLLEGVQQYAKRITNPASTTVRTGSKLQVRLKDPFSQVVRHYTQHNFWITNSEKARELSFIFTDNTKDGLREIITHQLSAEYMSLIDASIAYQFHLRPINDTGVSGAFQQMKANMATSYLGADFTQPFKQISSFLGVLQEVESGEFLQGLKNAGDKQKLAAYVNDSAMLASRKDKLIPQILEATKSDNYNNFFLKDKLGKIKEISLLPLEWGDGVASGLAGYIGYDAARNRGLSHTEAVLFGDRIVDKTQSSSRPSQKVPAEFDRALGNVMLTFGKQNIQVNNAVFSTVIDAIRFKDKATIAKATRTVAGWWIANAFVNSINALPGLLGNDKQRNDAIKRLVIIDLIGPIVGLPIGLGDIISGAAQSAGGEKYIADPHTIVSSLSKTIMSIGVDAGILINKGFQGEGLSNKEWWKLVKDASAVGGLITGVPLYKYYKTGEFGVKVYNKIEGQE